MKHLRKCDGYVLPYVLVVFLILSAVAVSICSTSLNNLKAQEAAVERSKALYEAEGEVEKLVARVVTQQQSNDYYISRADARTAFREAINTDGLRLTSSGADEASEDTFTMTVQAESADNSAVIDAVIQVKVNIVISRTETTGEGNDAVTTTYYKVDGIFGVEYKSYDISYQQPEEVPHET